jgi:hypothetical protein
MHCLEGEKITKNFIELVIIPADNRKRHLPVTIQQLYRLSQRALSRLTPPFIIRELVIIHL